MTTEQLVTLLDDYYSVFQINKEQENINKMSFVHM